MSPTNYSTVSATSLFSATAVLSAVSASGTRISHVPATAAQAALIRGFLIVSDQLIDPHASTAISCPECCRSWLRCTCQARR